MDMFNLGMDYSNDGDIDGGDNESEEEGGDNESAEGINAGGEDNEQNKGINDEEIASLRNKVETLQQANTKLEVECGGLMLAIEQINDEMRALQAKVKENKQVIAQKDIEIAELKNRIDELSATNTEMEEILMA
ncbi:hypothetical protein U1Q18_030155, partial [Sarracenia purpurea var. burkii]